MSFEDEVRALAAASLTRGEVKALVDDVFDKIGEEEAARVYGTHMVDIPRPGERGRGQ